LKYIDIKLLSAVRTVRTVPFNSFHFVEFSKESALQLQNQSVTYYRYYVMLWYNR